MGGGRGKKTCMQHCTLVSLAPMPAQLSVACSNFSFTCGESSVPCVHVCVEEGRNNYNS